MTKEKFIETIEWVDKAWQNIDNIQRECCLRLDEDSPYWKMVDKVIELLSIIFEDNDNEMIGWYCGEKDFGRNEHLGGVTIDRIEYPCNTAEDLYNILIILKERK